MSASSFSVDMISKSIAVVEEAVVMKTIRVSVEVRKVERTNGCVWCQRRRKKLRSVVLKLSFLVRNYLPRCCYHLFRASLNVVQ
ncbi:hypothetical protein K1719_000894 [Acacia pycnantha]|nr:hypothetical protein K1719_000894 [Acacia pycnantha]